MDIFSFIINLLQYQCITNILKAQHTAHSYLPLPLSLVIIHSTSNILFATFARWFSYVLLPFVNIEPWRQHEFDDSFIKTLWIDPMSIHSPVVHITKTFFSSTCDSTYLETCCLWSTDPTKHLGSKYLFIPWPSQSLFSWSPSQQFLSNCLIHYNVQYIKRFKWIYL